MEKGSPYLVNGRKILPNKDKKELRNHNVFTLPAISIERTSVVKDPNMKGVAWANIPRQNDAKGGAITVARRLQQGKNSQLSKC